MTDATSRITLLLGGRYRLHRELARGGMATVFHARDEVLERDVAVKVLHRHLAGDPTFLDRFLREARAAAGLSHPNVTSVYDWGQEVDGYGAVSAYLVMEFVDGPSLRDVLVERGRLSPEDTAAILLPAAAGIAAAHDKGLVHRDVKPENVLVTSRGMVKVTDFGLARAVTASRQTFGPGSIVGSPHYLAPEALKGGAVDTRADVYALGVLLYECLVGRPPFEGDTLVGTALRRAWETVPAPSLSEPVPTEVDEVVARATDLDPDARYPDARAFQEALAAVVEPGEVPVSRRDTSRDTHVLPAETLDTLVVGPAVAPVRKRRGGPPPGGAAPTMAMAPAAGQTAQRPRRQAPAAAPTPVRRRPEDGRGRGGMLALWIGLGLLVLLGAGYLAWSRVFVPVVDVPDVVRQPRDPAVATLRQAGFDPVVSDSVEFSRDVPTGAVVAQQPTGTARRGARVTLTLSGGPRPVNGGVPPVAGFSEARATSTLRQAGLDPQVERAFEDQVPEGIVIRTDPGPGGPVVEGQSVKVTVSRGPQPIEVPRVVGLQQADASAQISSLGLRPVVVEEVFNDAVPGTVLTQSPDAGVMLSRGDRVELRVSKGPQTVTMPDERGRKRDDAVKQLEALGLQVTVREVQGLFRTSGVVYDQDPKPGTSVRRGETVTVSVWK